jgi:copper(I)-binding protein
MTFFTKTALAVLLSTGMAHAHDYTVGDITIAHPMAFETAKTANVGGGYMTLTNAGEAPDRLMEVRVAQIPRVELHLSETDAKGVARMTKQDGISLPAGETVALEPGGLHVMFMGLNGDPFEVGEKIEATLVFETAGEIAVTFNVEARTAQTHGGADHSGHKMAD